MFHFIILLGCIPILCASQHKSREDYDISYAKPSKYDFDYSLSRNEQTKDYSFHSLQGTDKDWHFDVKSERASRPQEHIDSSMESAIRLQYANHLMKADQQVSSIKYSIDKQLAEINSMVHSGKTTIEDHQVMVQTLQQLATSFDVYCQTLQQQYDQMQQAGFMNPHVEQNLYAARYLQEELHNLLDSIRVEFFNKDGSLLDGPAYASVWNRWRFHFHHKTINDCITKYAAQYKNGTVKVIFGPPDQQRLKSIENNPINKALATCSVYLKQGNLDQAHKICQQFKSNRKLFRRLQTAQKSSQYLNQYGLPRIWQESHPEWHAYEAELKSNPKKLNEITAILQQDHNKAYALCAQAGIGMPTAMQLNHAHQLQRYERDPAFGDIAMQGLKDSHSFQSVLQNLEQRAAVLERIQDIVLHNPDSISLLQEHLNELILCEQDPLFAQTITHMVHQPESINTLKQELLARDLYVHELRKQLGYPFFTEHIQEVAYQLAGATNDAARLDILHNLCINCADDAYVAFYDTKTHLPKLFNYDQQLLKAELPSRFQAQDFAQERKLYAQVMMQPILCHEQFLQAQQCISFFKDACLSQEHQAVYRDLACTAAQTYLHPGYNTTLSDRLHQVELFDRAHKAVGQGDITQADIPQPVQLQVAENTSKQVAHVDYQQLYDIAVSKCATHQSGILADHYRSREHALKQMVDGNKATYKYTYELSSQAQKILEKNGCNIAQFTTCTGNLLQQDTHAKFVQTLNTLAEKPVLTAATQKIKEGVLECAQAGSLLNQNNNVKEAMILSDFCHVAVECLWHSIDTSLAIGKGVAEGVYLGVSSEITDMLRDPNVRQETYLRAGSFTESTLEDRVAMETATVVAEFLGLIRDSTEVLASGAAGVGDAVVGLPDLVRDCVAVTKLTGQCAWHITCEMAELAYYAECMDQPKFNQQLHKMQRECGQVAQGISSYLKELTACKKKHNGTITKEELKEYARSGGRFISEGIITSKILKGTTKIMKGAAQYVRSTESALGQLQHIKELSGSHVRNVLLSAQLNAASFEAEIASRGLIEQVVIHAPASSGFATSGAAQALKEAVAPAIIKKETAAVSSLAQRMGQLLTFEPKPGYILIPGGGRDQLTDNLEAGAAESVMQEANAIPADQKMTIDDLAKKSTFIRKTNGNTIIYESSGGYEQAKLDFKSLSPKNIKVKTVPEREIMVGQLDNGQTIIVRNYSTYGDQLPTLELQMTANKTIKFRYLK